MSGTYTDFDYTAARGDTVPLDFTITIDGTPLNPNSVSEMWFTGKKSYAQADPGAFQKKFTTGDIICIDAAQGIYRAVVLSADTQGLTDPTTFLCDLQVKLTTGWVRTASEGRLTFTLDITQAY